MDDFIEAATYWEMDRSVGLAAARICCAAQRRGIKIHVADALIGALAKSRGATVVSENRRDFEAIGVPLISLRTAP
jgi:predicted nucleic acid-binding protein